MGKTRAEIQRAYRQRLEEHNNTDYLKRERARWKKHYTPAAQLLEQERKARNTKNVVKLHRYRERQREKGNVIESSGYESGSEQMEDQAAFPTNPSPSIGHQSRLRVKLNFPTDGRRPGAIRRWKRELSESKSCIRQLEGEKNAVQKKFRTAQRALERLRQKQSQAGVDKTSRPTDLTPRKKTRSLIESKGLPDDPTDELQQTLLLRNVLISELKSTHKNTPRSKRKAIHRVISGKIVRKYKCSKMLAEKIGLCRHRLAINDSKLHQLGQPIRNSTVLRNKKSVEAFLMREENSREMPGKADKGVINGKQMQTYVLTDYLGNLYKKFQAENPDVKISFASFCRSRSKHVLLASFSGRSTCLCNKHQNASLTFKAFRNAGFELPANPEKALQKRPTFENIKSMLGDSVKVSQWTRVEVEEKGKKKAITRIVEKTLSQSEFIAHFETQMNDFQAHVERVQLQYQVLKTLKEKLSLNEIIVQLDFAENYSCKSADEVQSAFFNKPSVTLHPTVAYYKNGDSLAHANYIIVSNELSHKASTVLTFLDEIMPHLKGLVPDLKKIHYWSDSPSSQYRNRFIFDMVANHKELHGVDARWNFFESGHGKGPCDGLGGTCKRMADNAVNSGKCLIQDTLSFHEWALDSGLKMNFIFVASTKCMENDENMAREKIKTIKGTMKTHVVCSVGQGLSRIAIKTVSCYCDSCLSGKMCDSDWSEVTTRIIDPVEPTVEQTTRGPAETTPGESISIPSHNKTHVACNVGAFVAAIYSAKWYIG